MTQTNDDRTTRDDEHGRTSRRTMLRGAAVGGVALPLLAACGGGADGESDPTSATSGSAGSGDSSGSAGSGVTVSTSDVPVGGGTIDKDAKVVVTQPSKGTYKAFSAVCTHQGCLVGAIEDKQIVCPCHGSHFSIKNGSVEQGPATRPLPSKTVSVKGSTITVT